MLMCPWTALVRAQYAAAMMAAAEPLRPNLANPLGRVGVAFPVGQLKALPKFPSGINDGWRIRERIDRVSPGSNKMRYQGAFARQKPAAAAFLSHPQLHSPSDSFLCFPSKSFQAAQAGRDGNIHPTGNGAGRNGSGNTDRDGEGGVLYDPGHQGHTRPEDNQTGYFRGHGHPEIPAGIWTPTRRSKSPPDNQRIV